MREGRPSWSQAGALGSSDLLSPEQLQAKLEVLGAQEVSLAAGGDVMLGKRAKRPIKEHGLDYPFRSIRPLFKGAHIVLANHEGPFARRARPEQRNYSYRVDPALAATLLASGFNVVTLANNHLFDCGPEGVMETIDAVDRVGLGRIGVGRNLEEAHSPLVMRAGEWRVGLLGYYWNRRCAATKSRPGAATGSQEELAADIVKLRAVADRVVVTFHWGIPYERQPLEEDRTKARHAIDCGADLVIGHHPHILQPYEVYGNGLVFYSLGNLAFGSGNSRAEGLLVRASFSPDELTCQLFPLYVKNRDPLVDYQTRVLAGPAAEDALRRLSELSRPFGPPVELRDGIGYLRVAARRRGP